jgi:hypothetical protein
MKRFWRVLLIIISLMLALVVGAQEIQPQGVPPEEADVAIRFPPPVWVLSGTVEIIGTADLLNMSNYIVEYHEISFEEEAIELWFPATLPGSRAVRNGILGEWNTTTVRDGLYEIRLVVTIETGEQEYFVVSPLRVENDANDGVAGLPNLEPTLATSPTALGGGSSRPTLQATPTSIGAGEPTVTALTDANVRSGDDVSYPRVDSLLTGETARVLGISSFGSGWFYIETPRGRRGWIAPSVVEFNGDIDSLTRFNPPPVPTPPFTATPITSANLQVTGLELIPAQPRCNQAFDIHINVQNTGTGRSSASGTLSVIDRHVRTGSIAGSTTGGFPALDPGQSFVVVATLTINTYYGEDHDVIIQLDTGGIIPETNEGDNSRSLRYNLRQASC